MTYNFDPDEWYRRERRVLELRRRRGELDDDQFAHAADDLDRRHDEMLDRLDGSYQLPR